MPTQRRGIAVAPATQQAAAANNIAKTPKPSLYKRGTATSQTTSIAYKNIRPAHLDNKCLVVSRIIPDTTDQELKDHVNEIAGKPINIKHIKNITRKDFTKWRTVVLELTPDDFNLLLDENRWDPSLGIREFSGYKYWHNERRNANTASPPNRPNTTVGQSWAS